MRKNKMTGAIPGAGRPVENRDSKILNVRISPEAKAKVDAMPRMERGKFVSEAILKVDHS